MSQIPSNVRFVNFYSEIDLPITPKVNIKKKVNEIYWNTKKSKLNSKKVKNNSK